MKRSPGQVWFLPPEFDEGGDSKRRPHLLLTTCDENDNGTFAYASTSRTEAKFGATSLFVDPETSPETRTGLNRPTHIYASRLVAVAPHDFGWMAGNLIESMPKLRGLLAKSLGLGTGTTAGLGAAAGSWRGRIVLFSAQISTSLGYRYGIIVTEAKYSRMRRYQIVIPMDDLTLFEPEPEDLVCMDLPWISTLQPELNAILIGIADVQSVFHPSDIDRWTGAVIDEDTLAEIEAALSRLFEL